MLLQNITTYLYTLRLYVSKSDNIPNIFVRTLSYSSGLEHIQILPSMNRTVVYSYITHLIRAYDHTTFAHLELIIYNNFHSMMFI